MFDKVKIWLILMVRWVGDVFSSCAVYNFTFKDPGFGSHRPHKPSGSASGGQGYLDGAGNPGLLI